MNLFDYAIKMEREGEQYYRDQAAKNPEHAISRVFTLLAEAEVKHAQLLQRRSDRLSVDQDLAALRSDKTIFADLDDFKSGAITIPRQLDVYELALGLEKKSIEEYTRLKGASTDAADLQLLDFLIEQEEQHYSLFEQLVTLLRRPVDWVEDAEFGKRDEY
ncbi:MAG: ferritin family protein [Clostridiaceae bacterium]|jgi:rubrerythrin|nr:ferritin family protein [Clostridiales bacterium]MDD4140866.1 ferritin family protein [Eubacteriales bacterium]MDD4744326.1 ferritin family protein [Eubacteriales bacterium]NLB44762.1 ferritin family protein [Clostridiaceae bacterium]